jgi:hypothetical protein
MEIKMDTQSVPAEMFDFIKAVVNEDRLKIIGVLAARSAGLDELAQQTGLHPGRVAHQLDPLLTAGVVKIQPSAEKQIYELDIRQLEAFARQQLSAPRQTTQISAENLAEEDRKIVKNFTASDGRLKQIPSKPKQISAILQYIYPSFEPQRRYTEKEVNQVLSRFHPDVASLRRYLVDFRFLHREADGSEYWCIAPFPGEAKA